MIQYKVGDLTKWSCRPRPRPRPRLHLRLRLYLYPCLPAAGIILKIYDPKEAYEQDENFKYYEPERDLPYLWFSLKEKQSFQVFQEELSLVLE